MTMINLLSYWSTPSLILNINKILLAYAITVAARSAMDLTTFDFRK